MKIDRVGEKSYNNFGSLMVISKYNNRNNLDIYFPEYNWTYLNANYDNFKSGRVKCPYEQRVYNIGYIGEGKYSSIENGKQNKSYKTWSHMLERCYDDVHRYKFASYEDCYVCDDWLNYQNFAEWYDFNYYEINDELMCLDKDILVKGNKIYGPNTCVFVPQTINNLFTKNDKNRGELPIGVHKYYNKYRVMCSNGYNQLVTLGTFDNISDAFNTYKEYKETLIKQIADDYINYIPSNLYEAMYNYTVDIND